MDQLDMKKITLTVLSGLAFLGTQAQITNETILTIQNNLTITAQGGVVNQSTGEINNDGTIWVENHWDNHNSSGGLNNTAGLVTFNDNVVTLGGSEPTTFNNVDVVGASEVELNTGSVGDIACSVAGVLDINNGTLDLNERVVDIDNSSSAAINSNTGYIFDNNNTSAPNPYANQGKVRWRIGNGTGTYTIPFGESSSDDVPVNLVISAAGDVGGYIDVSTFATAFDNIPLPDQPTVSNLDLAGSNDSDEMVNRFWRVDASSYTSQPIYSIDFAYTQNDLCQGPTCPSLIDQTKLAGYRWDVTGNNWDLNLLDGTVTTSATSGNSGVFSSNNLSSGDSWWVLANRCSGLVVDIPSAIINACSSNQLDVNVQGASGAPTFLWSPSDSLSSTTVQNPTTSANYDIIYQVDVTDGAGCTGTDQVAYNVAAIPQDICLVTVDTTSNYNLVVWEKPATTAIDSFKVYRVTSAFVDSLIGVVYYDSLSEFKDMGANPNQTQYDYKISSLDTCGIESPLSDFHRTIHLTVSQGLPGQMIANWNHYIGQSVDNYQLWCDSTGLGGSGWYIVPGAGSLSPASTSFTDASPPVNLTNTSYRLQTIWTLTCVSTRANHNTTRSNRLSPGISGGIGTDDMDSHSVLLYPNPTGDLIFIVPPITGENMTYELMDNQGRVVILGKLSASEKQIDLSQLTSGVYIIRLHTSTGIYTGSIVKN